MVPGINGEQHSENQQPEIAQFAQHRGYKITRTFTVDDSAWKNGTGGALYTAELKKLMDAAHRGEFRVLITWSLDRITRRGVEDALRLIRQLRERGCTLVSVREPWLNGSPEITDILVSFAAWAAQQESQRRSERIRAGVARRKAAGLPVGRVAGATDKHPRRRSGYVARWERARSA